MYSVDLDIENGVPDHYAAFVKRIQSNAAGASKKYVVSLLHLFIVFDFECKDIM